MTDINREIDFYRSQYNNLGKRILQLQKDNTRILRDHKRTLVLAKLIAEAHRQTSYASKIENVGKHYLQILLGTLNVDRALILKYAMDKGCFLVKDALGFGNYKPDILRFSSLPAEFLYVNSKTTADARVEALCNHAGVPFLLWAFNPQHEFALLLGNHSEDNNLHAPFEKKDREIVEGALSVFIDIFKRKKAEDALHRRDSVLEAVGYAAQRFMRYPNWENYIDQILGKLGTALLTSSATLYRTNADKNGLIQCHQHSQWIIKNNWCQAGLFDKRTNSAPATMIQRWQQKFEAGKIVKGNIRDFIENEKDILVVSGIRSFLAIPIFCGEQWWGLMVFCDYFEDHEWPSTEIEAVKLAVGTLGALIQRNRMDESLRENEQKYRLIAENISDIVWTMDLGLQPTYVSPSIELILGLTVDEAMATPLKNLLSQRSYEETKAMFGKMMSLNKNELMGMKWPLTLEIELMHKNGSLVTCEASNLPMLNSDHQIVGFIGVTRDIRDRKRYEKELIESKEFAEKANRTKSDFLANMSHELRTPLNHIIGFTELIVDKNFGDLNETQTEYLNDVLGSGRHLLSLINDVLDLSKVESGKLELQLTEVKLRLLLDNSLVMIRQKALKHNIHLAMHVNGVPDVIQADERKLKQVLYNLLSNAVKFTPDGGEIRMDATLADISAHAATPINGQSRHQRSSSRTQSILISISDNGIGLKKEDSERIFDPFEQVERSTSRKYQGTGLGLSLTKQLVEIHGGKVWVESRGENRGSIFNFTLPIRAKGEKY